VVKLTNSKNKFYTLEVCRFGAALAVLFWHYQHLLISGVATEEFIKMADRTRLPLYQIFALFYDLGYFAVQIFWILSGFIFFWKYAASIHARSVSLRDFFVFRFSRLYPLHAVTLLAVCGLQAVYVASHRSSFIYGDNDAPHFLSQVFMASNWFKGQPFTFNGPIWSVSAEVIIYLAFFVLVSRIRPTLLSACMFTGLSWLALKTGFFEFASPMLNCAKFFFLGGAMQLFHLRLDARKRILGFAISLAVCLFSAALLRAGFIALSEKAVAVIAATFIFACVTSEDIFGAGLFEKLAPLGNLTYSTYLLHFPLQILFVLVVDATGLTRQVFIRPESLFVYLSTVFFLGYVAFHWMEVPMQSLIRSRMVRSDAISVSPNLKV
jgi:peptidoglycan/LPS O-acetylase OafA/YrhL